MNNLIKRRHLAALFAALMVLAVFSSAASAAEYWLRAEKVGKTMPDGKFVPMWGFALDQDHNFATIEGRATVPGPVLNVPSGDTTLIVHLFNNGLPEPVSFVINGQEILPRPVMIPDPDGVGPKRVRSFTTEAAPGAEGVYTFNNLRPGTYLYESGSHQAVQVQMGLYGAMVHNASTAPMQAYPGMAFDSQVTLLFSEIDPVLHYAVNNGNYGPGKTVTSTIDYNPKYFLINGNAFSPSALPIQAGQTGQTVLVRLLNAGLKTHTPTLVGILMDVMAEDGNPYTYPQKNQPAALLTAGKTKDVLIRPTSAGNIPVFDRSLALTNGPASPGGMLTYLAISSLPPTVAESLSGQGPDPVQ